MKGLSATLSLVVESLTWFVTSHTLLHILPLLITPLTLFYFHQPYEVHIHEVFHDVIELTLLTHLLLPFFAVYMTKVRQENGLLIK